MGELHLDIIVDRMMREFDVACNVGTPQVAYRETITSCVEQENKFCQTVRWSWSVWSRLFTYRATRARCWL